MRTQLTASKQALQTALAEKESIELNLAEAQKRLDGLLSSATQHSDDSTQLYGLALAEVRKLTAQLAESRSSVGGLRKDLESKQKEYDAKLEAAQGRAQALERQVRTWRIVAICAGVVAVVLGVLVAVK